MSFFASLFQRDLATGEYNNGGTTISPADWLVNYVGFGNSGALTTAGVRIDEWVAEGMPAVYACVHAISETVGQMPLKLYRKTDGGREIAEDHPLYWLLHDLPNPEMTAMQFREIITRHLAMWGRAYAYIDRKPSGEVAALWPLHPTRMIVDRDELNRKRFRFYSGRGQFQEWIYDPLRPPILHLHLNSNDGLDGRSPILINRESLGITKASDDFVGAYFGNGAIPGLFLKHPGKLSEKAKDNFKRSWQEKFGGAKNRNKMAVLPEGIDVTVVGVDPQKSQLDTLRSAQVEAAARIWRVPLFMIQNQTKDTSWGSGVEQQMIGWINTGLMPYFEQWQQAIARDLLNQKTRGSHYAKFVTSALARGDLKTRFESYALARQNGIFTADECREMEEFNKLPNGEGEVTLMPSGAQPVIGDGTPIDSTPAPVPPTTPTPATPRRVM